MSWPSPASRASTGFPREPINRPSPSVALRPREFCRMAMFAPSNSHEGEIWAPSPRHLDLASQRFYGEVVRATFIPVKFTEFSQPDATMPFGKELIQITKDLRIALPTITGKPTSSYPEDSCYGIEVHVPGRTFEPRTEPVDFKFIAPNWILGRDMAVHCALGRIKEVYRG
ncbi:hypothetical protein D1007_00051 [Hordeum vulgare]|nr:hypothetical protein D1007_00051 [Hordeum vulgare]